MVEEEEDGLFLRNIEDIDMANNNDDLDVEQLEEEIEVDEVVLAAGDGSNRNELTEEEVTCNENNEVLAEVKEEESIVKNKKGLVDVSRKDKEEGDITDDKEEVADKEKGELVKKEELADVNKREVDDENKKELVDESEKQIKKREISQMIKKRWQIMKRGKLL